MNLILLLTGHKAEARYRNSPNVYITMGLLYEDIDDEFDGMSLQQGLIEHSIKQKQAKQSELSDHKYEALHQLVWVYYQQ